MEHWVRRCGPAVLAVVAAAGCQRFFPTQVEGPQRVLVRDLHTNRPISGASVEYEFVSLGPRASIGRTQEGQIEVRPLLRMPKPDNPPAKPLPGEDLEAVWRQYNEPEDLGPTFNPNGSWDQGGFRERTISRTATTSSAGYALLPIIHAPIRFRECRLSVSEAGYGPVSQTVRLADLDRLIEDCRTIEVYLSPVRRAE